MSNWTVYKHILPDGKVYVGITSLPPDERWREGLGYEHQTKFFKQIVKFGWDNIKHEILASGLDEKQAREMEKEMIEKEHENAYNTHHRSGVDLSWIRQPVQNDDLRVRVVKFREFNDCWLNKVRHINTVPFDWEIGDDYIDFSYLISVGEEARMDVIRVVIPNNITYGELYHYLQWELKFENAKIVRSEKLDISRSTWYNRVAEVG